MGSGSRKDKLNAEPNKDAPASDGHQTGLTIMLLRESGTPADHPAIRAGIKWIKSNQRESGRWWTRSLNTDGPHFITYSGTFYPLRAYNFVVSWIKSRKVYPRNLSRRSPSC